MNLYNPKEHGALCDYCPLRGLPVVPPQVGTGKVLAFVAEAPGENEEKAGVPLIGWSGKVFDAALVAAGVNRNEVLVTNAVLCRPRDTKSKNAPPAEEAIACCRPRLSGEIADVQTIVAMGAVAVRAVAPTAFVGPRNKQRGITSIRGYPVSIERGRTLLPTVHPAFTLRSRNWTPAFFADIKKAASISQRPGVVATKRPPTFFARSTEDVRRAFEHFRGKRISVDVETTRDHPLQARLKCVGVSCADVCCEFWHKRSSTSGSSEADSLGVGPMNITIPLLKDMLPCWSQEDHEKVINMLKELFGVKDPNYVVGSTSSNSSTGGLAGVRAVTNK